MKSTQPERSHSANPSRVWKERSVTDLSSFFGFAAIVVLYLAMFVAAYQWYLHAPHLPSDDPPGLPIAETIL